MEQFEFVLKAIRNIAWNFILTGVMAIIIGVLIFIYPNFLNFFVALLLIILGISGVIAGAKINKYSKIKIKL